VVTILATFCAPKRAQRAILADLLENVSVSCDMSCPMCDSVRTKVVFRRTHGCRLYFLVRCLNCGQSFCAPKPTASEICSFYEGDYHAELRREGATEKLFGSKFATYRDWVVEFLKGGRSLDIGTATGLFPNILTKAGFEAEGLELNPATAEWGEAHYGVRIRTCQLGENGAEPGSYDLISMTDVLEHTENPLRFLGVARKYLRLGGYLLVTFPDVSSVESRYARFLSLSFRRDWIWYCCRIPLHVWEFTPTTARAMFEKAGFSVRGFRRRQEVAEPVPNVALGLLLLPVRLLNMPVLSGLLGSQMEFMLQRRD
jgi:2-polyprenyl-3-methyl-5-hydroxy-6-metoxy-1,4-benzoquinol methylase